MYPLQFPCIVYRILLAVLHHNENSTRSQMICKDGRAAYAVSFPKAKKGGAVVKQIKIPCTYGKLQWSL